MGERVLEPNRNIFQYHLLWLNFMQEFMESVIKGGSVLAILRAVRKVDDSLNLTMKRNPLSQISLI